MQEKFPDDRLKMKTGNLRRDFYRQQRLLPKQLIIPSRTNIMDLDRESGNRKALIQLNIFTMER